jgi:PAS domain S-box-containing protein
MDIIDHAGNILDCNEAFARFTGYPRSVLINPGTTFLGLTHPDSLNASYKLMSGLISGKRQVTRAQKKYVTNAGVIKNSIVTCWLVSPHTQVLGADGHPVNPSTGGPLIQAMIEELPIGTNLDDAYFELPYHPMANDARPREDAKTKTEQKATPAPTTITPTVAAAAVAAGADTNIRPISDSTTIMADPPASSPIDSTTAVHPLSLPD